MRIQLALLFVSCFVVLQSCHHALPIDDGVDDEQDGGGDDNWEPIPFDGIDLLVVIDNSGSMIEEQQILSTSVYTLVNALFNPSSSQQLEYPPIPNLRVAVVSSDMGLKYGEDGSIDGVPAIQDCGGKGDDGEFYTIDAMSIEFESGVISCDEGGGHCPLGFNCDSGFCMAPSDLDAYLVDCPSETSADSYCETSEENTNQGLSTEVACLSALGIGGCGIEQQLKAGLDALLKSGQGVGDFIHEDHLLALLVVSDEEDCSILSSELFYTDEWLSGSLFQNNDPSTGHLNTACNFPPSNNDNYLFDVSAFHDGLLDLKGGNPHAVVFAAIVGVPDGNNSPCQGSGDEIWGCLSSAEMQLQEELFEHPTSPGSYFYGFVPACSRVEDGVDVTTARPGRRFVELAEMFGELGYVYSICNENWEPAISNFSRILIASTAGENTTD